MILDPRHQHWSRWGLVLAYMAVLFALSSIPNLPSLPRAGSDKLVHAVLYAGLGAVSLRALVHARWHDIGASHAIGALLIAIIYGVFDEFHQSFVDGRESSLDDVVADAVGACVAAVGLWVWSILTRKMAV